MASQVNNLFDAAIYCKIDKVKEILRDYPDLVNCRDGYDDTPLHLASRYGNLEIVKLLISKGADVNALSERGDTALEVACSCDDLDMTELLLSKGAHVNAMSKEGKTALEVAKNDETRQAIERAIQVDQWINYYKWLMVNSESTTAINSALQQGEKEWGRSRIMLVGQGRAGKTALCNSLVGKPYQATESTVGINQLMCDIYYARGGGASGWQEYQKPEKELEAALASLLVKQKREKENNQLQSSAKVSNLPSGDTIVSNIRADSVVSVIAERKVEDNDNPPPVTADKPSPAPVTNVDEDLVMKCLASSIETESDLIVSLFDYGGQSVFNVIHHLFLTQNGVYVLAFNMEWLLSEGEKKEQCLMYLRFWSNSVWIHTHNTASGTAAPIALVGTRKDKVSGLKDHEHISTILHETFSTSKIWPSVLRNKQGQGINGTTTMYFYPVDNTRGRNDETMRQLLAVLENALNANPFTRKKVPLSWLRAVDEMQATGKSCLSFDMVYDLAVTKCGVLRDHVPYFLHFLHEMGIVLWHDEPSLREVVILDAVPYFVAPATRVICKHNPDASDGTCHVLDIHEECSQKHFNEWTQLTKKGVLDEMLLDVLWCDVLSERDMLLKLMVKFGLLVPLSSSSRRRRHAEGEPSSKKYIVPALLPRVDPSNVGMRDWTDESYQTCFFVFTASRELGENSVLLQEDIVRDGFFPTGLFERIVGKVISWSLATTKAGAFNIRNVTLHKEMAILLFGNQRFRLTVCPLINSIRVDIEGKNPLLVQDRLMYLIDVVLKECMRSLLCFTGLLYSPSSSAAISDHEISQFCFSKSDALMLLPLDSVRSAAESRSVLTLPGGRKLMTFVDAKRLFELWLKDYSQRDHYDVFISYRWGKFDGAFVSGLFDMFTNYVIGSNYRSIEVFLDKKRLKEGRQFAADFAKALTCSVIVLPMVSLDALQRMLTHNPSTVDNLLLEWILCLQCCNNASCKTKFVYPFAFGARSFDESSEVIVRSLFADGVLNNLPHVAPTATLARTAEFLQDNNVTIVNTVACNALTVKNLFADGVLNNLPHVIPKTTLERAAKFLKDNNVSIADVDAYNALTIHSIVTELMSFMCFQSWEYDPGDILEEGTDRVLDMLRSLSCDDAEAASASLSLESTPGTAIGGRNSGWDAIWAQLFDPSNSSDVEAVMQVLQASGITSSAQLLKINVDAVSDIAVLLNPKAADLFRAQLVWELLHDVGSVLDKTAMKLTLEEIGLSSAPQLIDIDAEVFDEIAPKLKLAQRKRIRKILKVIE